MFNKHRKKKMTAKESHPTKQSLVTVMFVDRVKIFVQAGRDRKSVG